MQSVAGVFFTAVNLVYAAIFGGPIDGTSWDVKVKEEGFFHWASQRETLVFLKGRAVIAGDIARGYTPALYDANEEADGTAFSVVLEDGNRDPIEWSGRVVGRRIAGIVIVRGRDGRVQRYVFSGARKTG